MKGRLARQSGASRRGFATEVYAEKKGWAAAGAPKIMARLLATSTADDETVSAIADQMGWSKKRIRDSLVAKRQPDNEKQKMGKFGEVLHAEILEAFQGMVVVTKRYRHNPAPNAPVHGVDLVALATLGGDQDERIVYVETKLRTVRDGGALIKARTGLAKISRGKGMPASLMAEMGRLHKGDPSMFKRLVSAARRQRESHYRIGAVFEESAWSNSHLDGLDRAHDPGEFDMAVDIVKIGSLRDLVLESYKMVV